MTEIKLHGILAKEFRPNFNLEISHTKEVFDAITCAYGNFRNRITELANQGIHFTILIDGNKVHSFEELHLPLKDKKVDIVPLICGQGVVAAAAVAGAVASVASAVGAALVAVGGFLASAGAIGQLAIGIGMMALQMALAPKPKMDRPESTVNAAKQSFLFGSKANTSEQGIPVPVGYGRLRVGSAVIQLTVKSYPEAFNKEKALQSGGQLEINDKITLE